MSNPALTQEQINSLGVLLHENDDRGAFYQLYHELTGNERVLEMANISQFQGFEGAVAEHANELIEAKFPDSYPEGGVVSFSKEIANNLYDDIVADFASGSGTGILSDRAVLESARETWESFDLGDQFPGNPLLAVERMSELDVKGAWDALDSEGTTIAVESAIYTAIPDIGQVETPPIGPLSGPWSEGVPTPANLGSEWGTPAQADAGSEWGPSSLNIDTGWGNSTIIDNLSGGILNPTDTGDSSLGGQDLQQGGLILGGWNSDPIGSGNNGPDLGWDIGAAVEAVSNWGSNDHSAPPGADLGGYNTNDGVGSTGNVTEHTTESFGGSSTSDSTSENSSSSMGGND